MIDPARERPLPNTAYLRCGCCRECDCGLLSVSWLASLLRTNSCFFRFLLDLQTVLAVVLGLEDQHWAFLRTVDGLALERLPDDMAVLRYLDILRLDDLRELVHLLFEGFNPAVQPLYLLGLKSDDLLGVFEFLTLGLCSLLALLRLEEEQSPDKAAAEDEVQHKADDLKCCTLFHCGPFFNYYLVYFSIILSIPLRFISRTILVNALVGHEIQVSVYEHHIKRNPIVHARGPELMPLLRLVIVHRRMVIYIGGIGHAHCG